MEPKIIMEPYPRSIQGYDKDWGLHVEYYEAIDQMIQEGAIPTKIGFYCSGCDSHLLQYEYRRRNGVHDITCTKFQKKRGRRRCLDCGTYIFFGPYWKHLFSRGFRMKTVEQQIKRKLPEAFQCVMSK